MGDAITYRWATTNLGDAWIPHRRFAKEVERRFATGEDRALVDYEARSKKSHDHYFATVEQIHNNLPDHLRERFPDDDTMRYDALIRTGFRNERELVCGSKAEALRAAAWARGGQGYSVIVVTGCVVTEYTAKSQSLKAMGKEQFQLSKDATLAYLAELIGVTTEQLSQARAA